MAKRRLTNRLSKQLSVNRSVGSSFGSGYLDPDTNILGEEKTFWWKHLGENTILPHSSTYNQGNETSAQLSFNSNASSTHDKSNWWKYLESDEQNISTLKHNYSAGLIKSHVMEVSTSESEKEPDVKRRKLPLRAANRKSDSNAFLNALNDNTTTVLLKQNNNISNKASDGDGSQRKSNENDSLSSNLETEDIVKLRPNIFKKKRKDEEITNKNVFQDMLNQDISDHNTGKQSITNKNVFQDMLNPDISDHNTGKQSITNKNVFQDMLNQDISDHNTGKQSIELVKESKSHLINRNINTNNDHTNEQTKTDLIEALQLRRKSIDSSNLSTQSTQNTKTNKTQNTDESDFEMNNESVKHKPRFMQRTRRSLTSNAFKDVLSEDTNTSVSEEIPSQDIDTRDAKVLPVTRSLNNSSKRSVSRSNTEIEKNTSFNKSSRRASLPKSTSSQKSDTSNVKSRPVAKFQSLVTSNTFAAESEVDIDKNMSISGNARSTSIINNSNRSIDTSNDTELEPKSQSPVSSLRKFASRSKSKIDVDKDISSSKNVMDPSSSKDNPSQNIFDTSGATFSSTKRSPKLGQRSKSKIDINKNTSLFSLRSSSSRKTNEQLVDTSEEENQNNYSLQIERSSRSEANIPEKILETADSLEIEKNNHEDVFTAQEENRMNKSKTVTRSTSSIVSYLNKDDLQENRETSRREKNLKENDIQNYNAPIKRKSLNKNITAFNISKMKTPRTIDTFFKQSSSTADKQLSSSKQMVSEDFNEKMERIKAKLEGIKNREIIVMKKTARNDKKESASSAKNAKPKGIAFKRDIKKMPTKIEKPIDKAFLVNGKVYRAPRLPRPKHWATDNLYRFLWKRMEPKYNLTTRVKSEKFMQELAKTVSFIERRKKYENYKNELEALMKEMARLSIICSRNDFYDFCIQFLPYEFRIKVVPMLLPGNKKNIPYDPEMLHTPLLSNEE
ncbi:rhoGEF domain-containing protein gxcJ-like isoform X2 [Pseudomyrmex gracilis]|uniref:rhoGEF domain-containing protein gxcJ-like isoform X2 n=1 Tax=Pseudomyrmex gracilis TaxID=219809 RepID=UPI000995007C|nr:rhoGEF domain-containing protein gxcJ-like isoform X2 [Pseudomyrmex gracilis]